MTFPRFGRLARTDVVEATALIALMGVYIGVVYHLMIRFIDPTYSYLGYTYESPDLVRNGVIIGFVLVLTLTMPRRIRRVSHFVLWMHFVLATVPSMLVPQFTAQLDQQLAFRFGIAVGLAWAGVLVATCEPVRRRAMSWARPHWRKLDPRRRWESRRFAMTPRRWTVALALASLVIDVVLLVIFGLKGELVGLREVRDLRLDYREAIAVAPPGTAYLLLFGSNVLNPVIIMRALLERRWSILAVGVAGQVLVYATAGYKMVLLSVPAVIILYLWLVRPQMGRGSVVLGGVAGVMVAAWVSFLAVGNTTLAFLFVMRAAVAPGNLAAAYVSIFDGSDPLYWSYSFMSPFIDYPYTLTPNYLVGDLFRGDAEISANVNLFGDGYMSLGWAGIAVECLVLVVVLLALDLASRAISIAEACAALLVPAFALCNSNIFTSLTTHGFLAAIVLLAVIAPASRSSPPDSPRVPRWRRRQPSPGPTDEIATDSGAGQARGPV